MQTEQIQDTRLDRIEAKIDSLSEAMVSLARAEEKLIAIEKNNFTHYERMNRFSEKLDELERKVEDTSSTVEVINRLFWIVVVATTGVVVSQFIPFAA